MEMIAVLTVGVLMAAGAWLVLDRSLVRVVLGIVVLGNGVNLSVMVAGRLGAGQAAFVGPAPALAGLANPLPQALVLTAIVIGFGLTVFALALLLRVFETHRSVKADRVAREGERPAPVQDGTAGREAGR